MSSKKPFEIFLIQHSHIDVGFTHRQELIGRFRADFLRQIVQILDSPEQQKRSDSSRFRWTCEAFWPVEQFLAVATEAEKTRLIQGFKDGDLLLSPKYLHLGSALDEAAYEYSYKPALRFAQEHGIDTSIAMSADINGFTWGMAEQMHQSGIRYLSTSINTHHGGHILGGPLKPFYWKTPSGGKILSWVGLTYHKANLLGLIPSLNPDSDAGVPGVNTGGGDKYIEIKDISMAEDKVFALVNGLKANGYAYDFMPIHAGGLYTDNNPPIVGVCDIIEEWNAKHGDEIFIHHATLDHLFKAVETRIDDIPEYEGDWTDWWNDGEISTPGEMGLFRNAQQTRQYINQLDPDHEIISEAEHDDINQSLLMYAEHTWGHTNSDSPWSLVVRQSLLRKGKFAVEADEKACTALDKVKEALGEGSFTSHRPFTYRVINALDSESTGFALLPYDAWEIDLVKTGITVRDEDGNIYPSQGVRRLREYFFAVELTMAPKQTLELTVEFGGGLKEPCTLEQLDSYFKKRYVSIVYDPIEGQKEITEVMTATQWENDYVKLSWDEARGVHSLIDKETGNELLATDKSGIGSPVYQHFPNGNRSDPAGFNMSARKIPEQVIHSGTLTQASLVSSGSLYTTLFFEYSVEGASHYTAEWTIPNTKGPIDISINLTKDNQPDPEGMYVAFPFDDSNKQWTLDCTGQPIVPGKDQLPGACADYFMVQGGAALTGKDGGIAFTTYEAPMVHIGGLNLWKFNTANGEALTGPLYSWLTNNKWEVNFCGFCGGFFQFRYKLDWGKQYADSDAAIRACRENTYPFLAVRTNG
jgi:hypothetical protein